MRTETTIVDADSAPSADHRTHLFQIFGFQFSVRSEVPEMARALDHLLDGFLVEGIAADALSYHVGRSPAELGSQYAVTLNGVVAQHADRTDALIDFVLWDVHRRAVETVVDGLALHAGAVSTGEGALLLPAPPDSGKTTLTAALVAHGFSYLTDETAALDPVTLDVQPYARALWMDRNTLSLLEGLEGRLGVPPGNTHVHVAPNDIRADAVGARTRVSHVITPRYEPGLREPIVEPLTRAEGLTILATNSFNFQAAPRRNLETLRRLLETVDCYRLVSGSVPQAVEAVAGIVRP